MTRYGSIALICAALACAAPASAAQLVTNGDFESDPADGSSITSWTVTGNGVADDQVFPNSGSHDVAFSDSVDDSGGGILSQNLTTTAGASYQLSFQLLDESGSFDDAFVVTFGGFTQSFSGLDAAFAYTPETFVVAGSNIVGTSTTLSFQGGLGDSNIAGQPWNLDDVSVTPLNVGGIPEPSSWALMLSGFFAIGWALRRRSVVVRLAR